MVGTSGTINPPVATLSKVLGKKIFFAGHCKNAFSQILVTLQGISIFFKLVNWKLPVQIVLNHFDNFTLSSLDSQKA